MKTVLNSTLKFSVLFVTVLFSAQSFAGGFSSGNQFNATLISGNVTVMCPNAPTGSPQNAYFSCRAGTLDPVEYDYFIGPVVDGDSITLKVTRADGSTRDKTHGYDGKAGKSTSRFNLWISSLTQRPLLADGNNIVAYKITKGGQSVVEGSFVATVVRQPAAVCRSGTILGNSPNDCQNQMTACGIYFEQNNYCQ